MNNSSKTQLVLWVFVVVFLGLATGFYWNLWGKLEPSPQIPLVDPEFIKTDTVRSSYSDLAKAKADLSDFDCYGCHEKNKPPPLRFDANNNLLIPDEHKNIVMGHGSHNRNNLCFNCHNETNLELLQTRDGRELRISDSSQLCGSCHSPVFRDWQAGAHGRTSGYWNLAMGTVERKDCVSCHNPHSPEFPGRKPAPPPHPLRPLAKAKNSTEGEHEHAK